jgi:hypothetical protein
LRYSSLLPSSSRHRSFSEHCAPQNSVGHCSSKRHGQIQGQAHGWKRCSGVEGRSSGWAPSTFSVNDLKKLRAAGLLVAATEVMMPTEEALPRPASSFRVMFNQFLYRGLSLPGDEFLRRLLFVYGV